MAEAAAGVPAVPDHAALTSRLSGLVSRSDSTMAALHAARQLGLASWCIGAGAIRNLVWDHLHGFHTPRPPADVDLVFYATDEPSAADEPALAQRLAQAVPTLHWDVVNQATVHTWLGPHARPFCSLTEGVASWPEVATCVGVTLTSSGRLEVLAPHGLSDLFAMVVRWNPTRASRQVYESRVAHKQWARTWPRVQVLPADSVARPIAPSSPARRSQAPGLSGTDGGGWDCTAPT